MSNTPSSSTLSNKRKATNTPARLMTKTSKKAKNLAGGRGSGFTQQEIDSFLELLEDLLPLCTNEWENVLKNHEIRYPNMNRTVNSLKRKFSSLHCKKMPTGDPLIPLDVKKTKAIYWQMKERADIGSCEDQNNFIVSESNLEDEECIENDQNKCTLGEYIIDNQEIESQSSTPQIQSIKSKSRPIIRKKDSQIISSSEDMNFIKIMEIQLLMQQEDRIREKEQREEDRIRREEDRKDDKERRAEEYKQIMMMFAMAFGKSNQGN